MSANMFQTLETTWNQSARRGWSAVASFTMQALALSLLFVIPLVTVQRPPKLAWLNDHLLAPPPAAPPAPASPPRARILHPSDLSGEHLLQPPSIPDHIADVDDRNVIPSPDVSGIGVQGGTGTRGRGIFGSVGDGPAVAPPPSPAPTRPLKLSQFAEANLIYRVQPVYPVLARQARIQGVVMLRAIISKTGAIENLSVLSGHAMLVTSAVEAVKQWRYRPYLLNNEPVEVETEITVNFTLGGN